MTGTHRRTLTAFDLFSGAGGLSLGLDAAGFTVVGALDSWPTAVKTYQANLKHPVDALPIRWNTALKHVDVIAGGPPCQGFSSAGRRAPSDTRNTLVAVFAHLVTQYRPKAFVFENVEGFLTGDEGRWVVDLLHPLVAAGYCVSLRKVNAANYGVPQHRKRVIVVGGLGWLPGLPKPTHATFGAPGAASAFSGITLRSPTVSEALAGLPDAVPLGKEPLLSDHAYRVPNAVDRLRMIALEPGQTMRDLPRELWHATYERRANRRVSDGTPTERRGGAPAGLRRLNGEEPSKAITSGATSEFVHPSEDRTLTLRECARLQTFPDDFTFFGSRAERALQVGNAVPPRLAAAILQHVADGLRSGCRTDAEPGVYEFRPTMSTGMSPALKRTRDLVLSAFGRGSPTTPTSRCSSPRVRSSRHLSASPRTRSKTHLLLNKEPHEAE